MGYHSHAGPSRMNKPAGATSAATSAATSGASGTHQAAEDDFKVRNMRAVRTGGHLPFAHSGLKRDLTGDCCSAAITTVSKGAEQSPR